jgi:hypothetical protein
MCHCTDCQRFAWRLGAQDRILNASGGTALYQTRCARVRLTGGHDLLASLHLTEKPTLRWYAACCRTPMFNTYATGRVPYVTVLVANLDPRWTGVLGPVTGHLFVDEATGPVPGPAMSMTRLLLRFLPRMLADIVSGDRRRCPLFDSSTLQPIAAPEPVETAC